MAAIRLGVEVSAVMGALRLIRQPWKMRIVFIGFVSAASGDGQGASSAVC